MEKTRSFLPKATEIEAPEAYGELQLAHQLGVLSGQLGFNRCSNIMVWAPWFHPSYLHGFWFHVIRKHPHGFQNDPRPSLHGVQNLAQPHLLQHDLRRGVGLLQPLQGLRVGVHDEGHLAASPNESTTALKWRFWRCSGPFDSHSGSGSERAWVRLVEILFQSSVQFAQTLLRNEGTPADAQFCFVLPLGTLETRQNPDGSETSAFLVSSVAGFCF